MSSNLTESDSTTVASPPDDDKGTVSFPYKGGSGGNPFDDFHPTRKVITQIRVRAAKNIDAIQVFYNDNTIPTQIHGGTGGDVYDFYLEKGEKIVKIDGRAAKLIDRLQFHTDTGRASPPYGGSGGDNFSWQAPEGYFLRYFTGRSAKMVDGLQGFFQTE